MALVAISHFLSYTVIAMSLGAKLPQLWRVWESGKCKGLDSRGYWLEIANYVIKSSYNYSYGYHFTSYLELVILAVQSAAILLLIIHQSQTWVGENTVYAVVLALFLTATWYKIIPLLILDTLLLANIPLFAVSKVLQIQSLIRLKSRGQVSIVTWSLAVYGGAARLFTVAMENPDLKLFTTYFSSFSLNCCVVGLCLYYGPEVDARRE